MEYFSTNGLFTFYVLFSYFKTRDVPMGIFPFVFSKVMRTCARE